MTTEPWAFTRAQVYPRGPADWGLLRWRRLRLKVVSSPYELESFKAHRCIFVHIPKTGGLALSLALFGSRGGGHRSLRAYEYTFGAAHIADWFTFTVVRHPIDRYMSAIRFLRGGGITSNDARFNDEVLSQYESIDRFTDEWLNARSARRQLHLVPQSDFLRSPHRSSIDYVARTESLAADYEHLRGRLGLGSDLQRENRSPPVDAAWSTISSRSTEMLLDLYAEDVDRFGYGEAAG